MPLLKDFKYETENLEKEAMYFCRHGEEPLGDVAIQKS